jgi:rSAM/selenodomain-associated transferase 2
MTFSIIVPALHEAAGIASFLSHLRSLDGAQDCEIIVVDGSPEQDTLAVIRDPGVIKLVADTGRARQMNAGAAAATGDILIFLHADTKLPGEALTRIAGVFESGGAYVGGAFDLRFDSGRAFIRFIAWSAGLRSRITRIPFGDQAIFLRKSYFDEVGGYRDIPLMEDVELMGRLKKRGDRISILKEPAVTSARKYLKDGIVYSAVRNHALRILYSMGVSPDRLVKLYYRP